MSATPFASRSKASPRIRRCSTDAASRSLFSLCIYPRSDCHCSRSACMSATPFALPSKASSRRRRCSTNAPSLRSFSPRKNSALTRSCSKSDSTRATRCASRNADKSSCTACKWLRTRTSEARTKLSKTFGGWENAGSSSPCSSAT